MSASPPSPAAPGPTPPVGIPLPPSTTPRRRKPGLLTRLLTGRRADDEVVVFHHSTLFYWWPVWLLGFLFALISYFDSRLAIVPPGTVAHENRLVQVDDDKTHLEERAVLILPKDTDHLHKLNAAGEEVLFQPTIHVTRYRLLGTVFVLVLLLVTTITNVTIRGLWSIFVVFVILMLTIILGVAGVWGQIFSGFGRLSIYINQGGYLAIAGTLFILWVVNFYAFDRQTYMIFTPGQVRVRLEIGGGETVYDTTGMVVQKQRADLFRHWVLGFGSGDLIIRPVGLGHALEMPNVLNVSKVVHHIEDVIKEKVIITQQGPRPS